MTLRKIEPLSLRGLSPRDPGPLPQLAWVDPHQLLVDESYQRGLSEAGRKLIRKIVNEFDWARFKPPAVVETDDGYCVIDGQHSAVAAVTHPGVELVPVLLHAERNQGEQAGAFISHNRDRLRVTDTQLHASAVVAGDPAALAVDRACRAAGVRVLRAPPGTGGYQPGDCVAVGTLGQLVRRRGEEGATALLRLLATRAPVTANEIRALDILKHDPDFRDDWDEERAGQIVRASSDYERREAEAIALTHERPLCRALALVWHRQMPRRRAEPQLVRRTTA